MKRTLRTIYTLLLTAGVVLSGFGTGTGFAQEGIAADVAQPGGSLPGDPQIQLVQVADGLADPVNVASPPDDDRLFIVERVGRIRILQDGQLLEEPFLDISDVVAIDFLEQGLLGLAFHPNYADNGRFFVYYTDWRTNGDSFLVEFSVSGDDPNVADPESAQTLLTHDQPYVNHNGGTVHFGPDGYLYWAMGDGGLAGDPYENAQDISTMLGSILRIDVDVEGNAAYAIPEDNPFSGDVLYSPEANSLSTAVNYHPDAVPEIWAYGLRNPWQFSFDPETGDLYIADVGQNVWEEVNFEPADSAGGVNYGWDFMEGAHPYPPEDGPSDVMVGTLPVAEYNHDDGSCSITGIGVYRGDEFSALDGIYFNSDFCSGKIWGLARDEGGAWQYAELMDTELSVTGSGSDASNNLYLTACNCTFGRDYDPLANPGGTVWQIVQADMVPAGAETAPMEGAEMEMTPTPAAEEEMTPTPAPEAEMTPTPMPEGEMTPTPAAEEEAAGETNEVAVSMVEWAMEMPNELPAGPTTFVVTNDGEFTHQFEIEGQGIDRVFDEDFEPGDTKTMTVDLEPGEYYVYCPIGNHAARGMELTLTVTE